jgi:hypothetical protein
VQAEAGDFGGALQTANLAESGYHRAPILHSIVRAQIKNGDRNGALATVKEAIETANKIDVADQRDGALAESAKAQAAAGNIKGALQTASGITNPYIKFTFALQDIIRMQTIAGDKTGAIETLQEAVRIGNLINLPTLKQSALQRTAIAQANVGDLRGALQTANSIGNRDLRTAALRAIASAQSASGDVKGSLELALSEREPYTNSYVLLGVAEGVLGLKPKEVVRSLASSES